MSKRLNNENNYPFYWLDETVEATLNPAKANLKTLSPEVLQAIRERLPGEIAGIAIRLKTQTFSLYSGDQIKVVAGHYDQAVRLLQQQAAANLSQYPKTGLLRRTGELILEGLDELFACLYRRYPTYLPEHSPPETRTDLLSPGLLAKILCALSADQIGILLKSAFDVKLILSKSFRAVCKAVAPYLSTPWNETIKWETVRGISGRAELRDKEVAIDFLEKMIAKIRDRD